MLSLMARPRTDGKTRPDPSAISAASCRTAIARPDSGTRCSLPAFIRSAGIVHVAVAMSISAHVASRTSLDRAAVSTRNSNANFDVIAACEARTPAMALCHFAMRQGAEVCSGRAILRQGGGDGGGPGHRCGSPCATAHRMTA